MLLTTPGLTQFPNQSGKLALPPREGNNPPHNNTQLGTNQVQANNNSVSHNNLASSQVPLNSTPAIAHLSLGK